MQMQIAGICIHGLTRSLVVRIKVSSTIQSSHIAYMYIAITPEALRMRAQSTSDAAPPSFNPNARVFQPNIGLELRAKHRLVTELFKKMEEYKELLSSLHEECTNTIGHLEFAVKDIKDVAKGLEEGGHGGTTNAKKLRYRSTDINAVVDRHRELKARLENIMPTLRQI